MTQKDPDKGVLTTCTSDGVLDAILKTLELNGWLSSISPDHLPHLFSMLQGLSSRLTKGLAGVCESNEVFVTLFELGERVGGLREGAERW